MLTFKPKPNTELPEKYKNDDRALGYIGYDDNGNECGMAVFYLDGYTMEIIEVSVPDKDPETQEGLIRSALNYGGNRNAYIAYYSAIEGVNVAGLLGFEKNGDRLSGEIPFLLAGHCCKH